MIREELLEPVLTWLLGNGAITLREYKLLLSCDEQTQLLPILGPPADARQAAKLTMAAGQTRSGENLTSWKGTELNRARIRAKAQQLRLTEARDYAAYNYGDDTVLVFQRAKDADAWSELTDFAGFKETVALDTTFLMRHLPEGYSYLNRMLMACINREMHQEPLTTLAAASAIATRHELLSGHPQERMFHEVLTSTPWPPRMVQAINIAFSGAAANDLTLAAAREQMALAPQRSLDPFRQQLNAQDTAGDQQELLLAEMLASRRIMRFGAFTELARELPLRTAERLIATRSYTLEH
jgi:hypothetical protein